MKKIVIKKKQLQKNMRRAVIAVLIIAVVVASYNAYAMFQKPETIEKSVPIYEYSRNGRFNYMVYLKNNSIYNTSILYPGQGFIFKKITDHINASYDYKFNCEKPADISGSYSVIAHVQTDIWEKEFVIVPKTSFNATNSYASFSTTFPINYTYFEGVVDDINNETGVTAEDPTLVMKCNVYAVAETNEGNIYDSFTPSLSIPLGGNIIEINGDLSQIRSGALEDIEEVFQPGVITQRNTWIVTAIIVILLLVLLLVFTENEKVTKKDIQKMLKKIHKKYGEWIVEVNKPLKRALGAEVASMKSLEDLITVGEELGKPILYYKSSSGLEEKHTFYVIDEATHYEYVLIQKEK